MFVEAPAPAPAPVVEAPAPVEEAAPAEYAPAESAPAPAVVTPAPAPVVVAPAPAPVVVAPAPAVNVAFFHTHLGHHGRWVAVASYGQVWVPSGVAVGWRPYTAGHWVYTDAYGWMWVSDEPWGWATYHYGRWAFAEPYGWVWVPGTVWGPAWVVWRSGGGYVGWAPMPPAVVIAEPRPAVEVNININLNVVERIHHNHWVFVSDRHVLEPVHRHVVVVKNNVTIIKQTRPTINIVQRHGRIVDRSIPVRDVERATGRPVRTLRVREVETDSPSRAQVKKDEVVIQRPRLRAASRDAQSTTQSPAKPRSGSDTTAGQPTRTRAQPAAQQPAAQPKPTTPAPRGGVRQSTGQVKRADTAAKIGTGAATATPTNPQTGKTDSGVRDRVRRPASPSQETVAPPQPQQGMRSDNKKAPAVGDHYTQPFPPPVQPKVDPGPRRPRQAPKPAEVAPPAPKPTEPAPQTPAAEASRTGTVQRSSAARQPKIEPTGQPRPQRDAAVKRVAPKQPAVEQSKPAAKTTEAAPADPAPGQDKAADAKRDRSQTVKRVPAGQRDKSQASDVERENERTRRD